MKKAASTHRIHPHLARRGAALVIMLAMLVLLLGLVFAFLLRSGINRQTSASSASLTAVDLLATVAINGFIGDLQQEIKDGSKSAYTPPNGGDPLYLPLAPEDAVPKLDLPGLTITDLVPGGGTSSGLENLIKVSTNGGSTPTDEPSLNGRSISREQWNKPLLMKRAADDGTDDSPPAKFPTPDWILVDRDGGNSTSLADAKWNPDTSNRKTVIGRYAYAVYNQGGLLDANVAGYPASANPATITGTNIKSPARYKTSAAYADLTIPEIGLTAAQIDILIKDWRNQATFAAANPAEEYFKLNLQNEFGFLSVSNKSAPGGATDRMFVGRRQLIDFFESKLNLKDKPGLDALQYFTTYSRSLNRPTFYRMQGRDSSLPNHDGAAPVIYNWSNPATDTNPWTAMDGLGNNASGEEHIVNPIIPGVTMAASGTRIDGTAFKAGDPILKKRFPLSRLAWITYKGPSADLPGGDPVIAELKKEGVSQENIDQGTADNIEAAFGLIWTAGPGPDGLGGYWTYNKSGTVDAIQTFEDVAALGREPNFFEILKATIDAGAIGRARSGFLSSRNFDEIPFDDNLVKDSSINNQIFQLAANIMDQSQPENYPTHIVLPDGGFTTRARSFWGVVDLPYFYGYLYTGVLVEPANPIAANVSPVGKGNSTDTATAIAAFNPINQQSPTAISGVTAVLQIPILWNPHGQASALPANLSPSSFRICVTTSSLAMTSAIGSNDAAIWVQRVNQWTGSATGLQLSPANSGNPEWPYWTTNWQSNVAPYNHSGEDAKKRGVLRFFNDDRTALQFSFSDSSYFRNPTPLIRNNFPAGLNLSVTADHQLSNVNMGGSGVSGSFQTGVLEKYTNYRYLGFLVGRYPSRYNTTVPISNAPLPGTTNVTHTQTAARASVRNVDDGCLTYSLEYTPDSGGTWIPYKQIALPLMGPPSSGADTSHSDPASLPYKGETSPAVSFDDWVGKSLWDRFSFFPGSFNVSNSDRTTNSSRLLLDPRTTRWGANGRQPTPRLEKTGPSGPSDSKPRIGEFLSIRSGGATGSGYVATNRPGDIGESGASSKTSLLWDHASYVDTVAPSYLPFYDADGVLRRPMAGAVPNTTTQTATSTVGLPMAQGGSITTGADRYNRPIILNRPFRSVAELSHAFSDAPWRNIDFSNPESGYTGLLDVFCVTEDRNAEPVVAGKVDLNTRQMPVLKALLAGGYRDAMDATGIADLESGDDQTAEKLAVALINRTTSTNAGKGPLWNVAHLVGRFDADANIQAQTPSAKPIRFDGFSADVALGAAGPTAAENVVQRLREAPIRVLSQNGQAGTWNLLVDLVAQSGKYPASAQDLNDFVIEAEKRVWLHLAVDRLTGKLVDYEIEVVTE